MEMRSGKLTGWGASAHYLSGVGWCILPEWVGWGVADYLSGWGGVDYLSGVGRITRVGEVGWGVLPEAAGVVAHEHLHAKPTDGTVHLKREKEYKRMVADLHSARKHPVATPTCEPSSSNRYELSK